MIQLDEPPIGQGCDAVAAWAQRAQHALAVGEGGRDGGGGGNGESDESGDGPGSRSGRAQGGAGRGGVAQGGGEREKALLGCLGALAGTRRAAQEAEALLQAAAQRGEAVQDAAGPESPQDEVALVLWQWFELARVCYAVAVLPGLAGEALDGMARQATGLKRCIQQRPTARAEEVRRVLRLPRDVRQAVREHEEVSQKLAEEALDEGAIKKARTTLVGFGHWMQRYFKSPKHIQIIAAALERIERGECKRLIIEVSPRYGKSNLASVLFAAWYMGRNPDRDIIAASMSQGLANIFGMQVRDLVQREEYKRVFPGVIPDGDGMSFFRMGTTDEWVGSNGERGGSRMRKGTYQTLGRTTGASGKGCNLLLIDDLIDEKEADSDAANAEARRAIQALRSRLAPESEGAAWVIINTRYREDDPIGYCMSEFAGDGPWETIKLPAWSDDEVAYTLPNGDEWVREAGTALWPERYTAEELMAQRDYLLRTSPRDWWAQFCLLIVPATGAMISMDWFAAKRYNSSIIALRQRSTRVVVSVDTSKGASAGAARTAIGVWFELSGHGDEDGAYLVDAWAEPILAPQQIEKLKAVCDKWRPHAMLIEDKSTGEAVIPFLRQDPKWVRTPIFAIAVCRDKVERMNLATPQMRDGQVWLPDKSLSLPWLPAVEREWMFFPKGKFKDQADQTSQFLNWRRDNPVHSGTIDMDSVNGAKLRQALGGSWGVPGGGGTPGLGRSGGARSNGRF